MIIIQTELPVAGCYFKTVLTRIISIVRVPSLCFNKDTHNNYDDELLSSSLSVKLGVVLAEKLELLL